MDTDNALDILQSSNCISKVLHQVKSGKEADVYCCEAQAYLGVELLAAKVYRPLETRGFRDDSLYQEGRFIKNSRLRRACHNKSRAGRRTQFDVWVSAEYDTLRLLHAAGARVLVPHESLGSAIVMQYIGTHDQPAPTLNRVNLSSNEATLLLRQVLHDVRLWFSCGRIHADLSPYNILYNEGSATIIDFPQAVDPNQNPSAFGFLVRDVEHIADYFMNQGAQIDAFSVARSIWNSYSPIKL